jgi:hypothetical protein
VDLSGQLVGEPGVLLEQLVGGGVVAVGVGLLECGLAVMTEVDKKRVCSTSFWSPGQPGAYVVYSRARK